MVGSRSNEEKEKVSKKIGLFTITKCLRRNKLFLQKRYEKKNNRNRRFFLLEIKLTNDAKPKILYFQQRKQGKLKKPI